MKLPRLKPNKLKNIKKIGIVGASGYTGLELIRILDKHPQVQITKLFALKTAGENINHLYPHLGPKYNLLLEELQAENINDLDILFLSLPHGTAHKYLKNIPNKNLKIIDLSADFRVKDQKLYEKYYHTTHEAPELLNQFVLGFPEIFRKELASANLCANPGCYSTSVILALYPLVQEKLINTDVIVDSKSGVSGAGKTLKETSLFCEANENISAYQTGVHRHTPEMEEVLKIKLLFSPHLVPMNRGILSSIYLENENNLKSEDLINIYQQYYQNEPFVKLLPNFGMPTTKLVKNSNNIALSFQVLPDQNKIVIFSAIDNLIKGASGQAVQNMNIMCGFEETLALENISTYL